MERFKAEGDIHPRPRNHNPKKKSRYGKATSHRNLTGTRMQVRTACTAAREFLHTKLCSGA